MDGRLGCININGHARSHVHISCQGQYGKNLDQRSNFKRERVNYDSKKYGKDNHARQKVRYSESVNIHFYGVA